MLFDGLDEVGSKKRPEICDLLDRVAKRYSRCQMVVTCRTAIYRDQLSERFPEVVKVADFDDAQVRRFLHNWRKKPDDRSAEQLLMVLRETPTMMQLARNPLLLTMIAYIYAHRGRDVLTERRQPRLLSASLAMSVALVALAIAGLATYNLIGFFGSWPWFWGPGWLAWVAVASAALWGLASLAATGRRGRAFTKLIFTQSGFTICAVTLLYALGVASHYIGWELTATIVMLVISGLLLLTYMLSRLERAANNPLRGLIELDEQAAQSRTSIIVG
jgi:hypothetical protein